jgi:hypothetical protein
MYRPDVPFETSRSEWAVRGPAIVRPRTGHPTGMTDPNDDLSSIADPGAMGPDQMAEPDNDLPGDLDVDHADLARADGAGGTADDSQAIQGAPVGPPD